MNLARTLAIVRHELRLLKADPVGFIVFSVTPLIIMAFLKPAFRLTLVDEGRIGANGSEQAVPGIIVMFAFATVGATGFVVFREHNWGTWERLRASNARPIEVIIGLISVPLLQGFLQALFLFIGGALLFSLTIQGSPIALLIVALSFSLCLVGIGLLLVAVCRSIIQLNAIANLTLIALGGLGGAITTLSALPGWVQAIAPLSVSYWAMRGYRSVILDAGGVSDVMVPVGVLLAAAALSFALASARFRSTDSKSLWA